MYIHTQIYTSALSLLFSLLNHGKFNLRSSCVPIEFPPAITSTPPTGWCENEVQSFTFAARQRNWVTWRRLTAWPRITADFRRVRVEVGVAVDGGCDEESGVGSGAFGGATASPVVVSNRATATPAAHTLGQHTTIGSTWNVCSRYWTWPLKDSVGALSCGTNRPDRLSAQLSGLFWGPEPHTHARTHSQAASVVPTPSSSSSPSPSPSKQQKPIRIFCEHSLCSHSVFICIISCSCEPSDRIERPETATAAATSRVWFCFRFSTRGRRQRITRQKYFRL